MIRILIGGEQIDVSESTVFEQSFQAFDISSLTAAKSDSTSTITVPATDKNKRLFGIAGGSANTNSVRREVIRVDIIEDGISVMGNGLCVLQEWDNEIIRFNAFKGAISLFDQIGEDRLSDLDLSDLDHVRSRSVIISKRYTTEGVIYPVINYGKLGVSDNNLYTQWQLPSVFAKTIVGKIMEKNGFSLSGRILDHDNYNNLVVPLTTVLPGESSNNEQSVGRAQISASDTFPAGLSVSYVLTDTDFDFTGNDIIPCFSDQSFLSSFGLEAENSPVHCYVCQSSGSFRFSASVTVLATDFPVLTHPATFRILVESPSTGISFYISPVVPITSNGYNTYNTSTGYVSLQKGDKVVGVIAMQAVTTSPSLSIQLANLTCVDARDTDYQPYNSTYDVGANMPEMKQVDFLKAIFGIFQVIPVVNPDTGIVNLWSYEDAYKDVVEAADWSSKVDLSAPVTRSGKIPGFARENLLKYDNEAEFVGELYGSGSIIVNDESIAEKKKDLIQLPFSASLNQEGVLTGIVPVTILLHVFDTTTGEYMENVDGIRVALLKRFPSTGIIQFADDDGSTGINTNIATAYFFYPDAGYPSLGYSDTSIVTGLITSHWGGVVSLLDNPEMVRCQVRLSVSDIAKLDLTKPVYIREFGANYIINKTEGYRSGYPAKVELIRM